MIFAYMEIQAITAALRPMQHSYISDTSLITKSQNSHFLMSNTIYFEHIEKGGMHDLSILYICGVVYEICRCKPFISIWYCCESGTAMSTMGCLLHISQILATTHH